MKFIKSYHVGKSISLADRGHARARALGKWGISLALFGLGLLVSFPFLWMVRTSFMPPTEALKFPPTWVPPVLTFENYHNALTIQPFARYILNSAIVAMAVVFGQLTTASMGAYAFARLRFPGRDQLFLLYLATMMIPFQVTVIPLFVMVAKVGWVDTYAALIVPGLASAYLTFLLRQFFLSIPWELEDAARIDGAGYFRTYATIILPLSKPALASCGLLSFMGSWTNFLWPLIVIRTRELRPVPLGLAALQQEQGYTDFPQLMAGSVMALLPIMLVFVLLQRYFVQGIALTGLKG
ncbi:MAG: sugar ABC transporter permease [Litorilinea sp.]|nr:MAG: sugar ABC transporter permease [Litorilinea sp.]